MHSRYYIMFKEKKAQEGVQTWKLLLRVLLVAAIAILLFLMLRSIANGVLPK